jgi:hypothetical protein
MAPRCRTLVFALALAPLRVAEAQAQSTEPRLPEAAKVYDAAALAYKNGQYGQAALLFARADELAANDVALAQALQACVLADDAGLGMGLAERASRAAPETPLARDAAKTRKSFENRVGRIVVHCPDQAGCALDVDGVPLDAARRGFVVAGEHTTALHVRGLVEQRTVTIVPGATLELSPHATPPTPSPATPAAPEPPPPPPPPAAEQAHSPTWPFWTALAVTGALGVAGAVSLVDLVNKHDAFRTHPDDASASSGRSAQTRTDVLFVAAGIGAIATAVIGVAMFRAPAARPAARVRWGPTGVLALF